MNKKLNNKRPANISLNPSTIDWKICNKEENSLISNALKIKGIIYKDFRNFDDIEGFYFIDQENNKNKFLKVVNPIDDEKQFLAEEISNWLRNKKIETPRLIKKTKLMDLNRQPKSCYLYPYFEGRYCSESKEDLFKIGYEIGRMHKILNNYPAKNKIKLESQKRHERLKESLEKIRNNSFNRNKIPIKALNILDKNNLPEITDNNESQVLHGDLNKGNILITNKDNKVIFLDFEDTFSSWGDKKIEISFVIERFCLNSSNKDSKRLIDYFLNGYKTIFMEFKIKEKIIYEILKLINLRTLIVLSEVQEYNLWQIPPEEWDKFINLYLKASNNYT